MVDIDSQKTGKTPPLKPNLSNDNIGLEDIVRIANRIGLEYVEAKRHSDKLEMMKPVIRAKICNRLDDGKVSEAKLRRLMEVDPEYIDFIDEYTTAKCNADRLKIRYDSYKNLFEAKRSMLSMQKAEMKLL